MLPPQTCCRSTLATWHLPGGHQGEDGVSGSSLEDAALGTSESQAKPKTKGFGEPRSLEKEVRCFSLVDVSFYSWFLIKAQTTCGPIPTLGWQYLCSCQLGIVHWAGHSREKKSKSHAIINQALPCAQSQLSGCSPGVTQVTDLALLRSSHSLHGLAKANSKGF